MTWLDLHTASEKAAIEAEQAFRGVGRAMAAPLYAKAAELEQQALAGIPLDKTRTRGIVAVSAVSLSYKAGDYARAEQLAHSMLADLSIPGFARSDLRNLVQAIWTELTKTTATVGFLPGQVFVSVKGGEVIAGGAPLDLVLEKVQTIQSMFYRTIEFVRDMPFRSRGPTPVDIQDACRPWLFQAPPGSYQFSVAIQEPKQLDFFKEDVRPEFIANQFLDILRATSADDPKELEAIVSKPEYRTGFLKLSRNLAPTGKTFGSIEFRMPTRDLAVALTPEVRNVINKSIKKSRPDESQAQVSNESEEEISGILRAVDLEKDFLDIVVNGSATRIKGLGDAMDDVIGPMVNKSVKVTALRGPKGSLRLHDIELVD